MKANTTGTSCQTVESIFNTIISFLQRYEYKKVYNTRRCSFLTAKIYYITVTSLFIFVSSARLAIV